MGYAGNSTPQFIIPSLIAQKEEPGDTTGGGGRAKEGIQDLDFYIGEEVKQISEKIKY